MSIQTYFETYRSFHGVAYVPMNIWLEMQEVLNSICQEQNISIDEACAQVSALMQ